MKRWWRRRWLAAVALGVAVACGSRTELLPGPVEDGGTALVPPDAEPDAMDAQPDVDAEPPLDATAAVTQADKLDILLTIDNSSSMAWSEEILGSTLPELVSRLVNPVCVDADGVSFPELTPPRSTDDCPEPLTRQFRPLDDIHVGVITSSLGGFGSNQVCAGPMDDDRAHLLGTLERAGPLGNEFGFLEWGPESLQSDFEFDLGEMVTAAGEEGCGLEATQEAWYRFLVDPKPYDSLRRVSCSADGAERDCVVPDGVDQVLLEQRRAFLRPDSAVVVIMLADENDCSVKPSGQSWMLGEGDGTMFRASSACEEDPNSPCCYSCGDATPQGCPADARCLNPRLTAAEDVLNVRCFDQKRRFGVDFLFPVQRYVNALTKLQICPERPDLDPDSCPSEPIENPLFPAPSAAGQLVRRPNIMFMLSIVGVPWQDLAESGAGTGDAETTLVYKTPQQLKEDNVWELIAGTEDAPPLDPLMQESIDPRSGTQPITMEALASPDSAPLENSINGHEYFVPENGTLQHACIFPLAEPRDCRVAPLVCPCGELELAAQNPVCQDPATGEYSTLQHFARAYPGVRYMRVLSGLEGRGIPASICARNVEDTQRPDFGYRPAVNALIRELSPVLAQVFGED